MEKKLQQVFWLLFFLLSHVLQAQEWHELEAILPPYDSLSTGTAFGKSAAFNGSTVVVGAPAENNERGAAYVYEKIEGKWKKVARLTSSEDYYSRFGEFVTIEDQYIFIRSSPSHYKGQIHIFEKPATGWTDMEDGHMIQPPDEVEAWGIKNTQYSRFGQEIAVEGNLLVVGAPGFDNKSGIAFFYSKPTNGWSELDQNNYRLLMPQDVVQNQDFGEKIAISGSTIAVSAPGKFRNMTINNRTQTVWDVGEVYVYGLENNTYFNVYPFATLLASNGNYSAYLGKGLSFNGDQLLVGVPGLSSTNDYNRGNGGVLVFPKPITGWSGQLNESKVIRAEATISGVGSHVSVSPLSGTVAIGANQNVIVYEGGFGTEANPIAPQTIAVTNGYESLSYDGNMIWLGNGAYTDEKYQNRGSIYRIEPNQSTWPAQPSETIGELYHEYPTAREDNFGKVVALDGDYAVITSPGDDRFISNGGAVEVYYHNGQKWQKQAVLSASDAAMNDGLGIAADIEGDHIAVLSTSGKLYVYQKPAEGWQDMTETLQISESTPDFTDFLSLTIYQGTLYAGGKGGVLVYEQTNGSWSSDAPSAWLQIDPNSWIYELSMEGNLLAAGSEKDGDNLNGEYYIGAVFLFEKPSTGWVNATPMAKLTPPTKQDYQRFGSSVDIEGNTVVVGAEASMQEPMVSGGATDGAVYIFEKPETGWLDTNLSTELRGLKRELPWTNHFGKVVHLLADTLYIGASEGYGHFDTNNLTPISGQIYVHQKPASGWADSTLSPTLFAPAEVYGFGEMFDLNQDHLLVGLSRVDQVAGKVLPYSSKANQAVSLMQAQEDQTTYAGIAFSYQVPDGTFADPDHDQVYLSAKLVDGTPLPGWLTFTRDVFSGTPANEDQSELSVILSATDSINAAAQDTFRIMVLPNHAPVVNQTIADQEVYADSLYMFTIPTTVFSDEDGDILTLNLSLSDGSSLPSWLSYDANTRILSGTAPSDSVEYQLKLTANDRRGGTVPHTFSLNVQKVSTPQTPAEPDPTDPPEPDPTVDQPTDNPVTSVADDVMKEEWIAYPNPSTGEFYLKGLKSRADVSIRFFNTQGQKVAEMQPKGSGAINISNLPKGIYILEIQQEEQISKIRLIKN